LLETTKIFDILGGEKAVAGGAQQSENSSVDGIEWNSET
jgi:hypothetical protein